MPHDLFISYAHQGDNTSREAVAALVARLHAELEAEFRRRFNRDLEIFFDKEDIKDFDHWQVRCHRALRDSRFFIACLSRSYLRSDACRWEWEEWCRHELEHGLVGQGAASLWFVKLEDLDAPEDAALLRRWKGDLLPLPQNYGNSTSDNQSVLRKPDFTISWSTQIQVKVIYPGFVDLKEKGLFLRAVNGTFLPLSI
jgi:hypothetical protein